MTSTQFTSVIFSVAIATKENMQSQKTTLKLITEKMNTVASILTVTR